MCNLSSQSGGVRVVCALLLFLLTINSSSTAEDCPPCFYNQNRPNTTGNGTSADGRPKLLVQVDSSWNVNNSGASQSETNANIWNAIQGCNGCPSTGAADMWNSATGANESKAPFYVELNQSTSNPNIIITRGDTGSDCATITTSPNGGPYTVTLPLSAASLDMWSIVETIAHEIGHAIGLANITDLTTCGSASIMSPGASDCSAVGANVTQKDVNQSRKAMNSATQVTCEQTLPGSLIPRGAISPTPTPPSCGQVGESCANHSSCCSGICNNGQCSEGGSWGGSGGGTPVVLDIYGDGFSLTAAIDGVDFDLNADGVREKISWTTSASDDAWLALDRNANGTVDSGSELFGNFTPQSETAGVERNGFLALGEFDKTVNGGNSDGVITAADAVFASLRLWQDANHNGTSELFELHTLPALNVQLLELDYKTSRRTDEHGNRFRYRAKVRDAQGAQLGRWAWDVILVASP